MNAHEIIVHEVDRHHMRMVHGLFRKGVREPRHATVAHADVQILTLDVGSRDVLGVWIALDAVLSIKSLSPRKSRGPDRQRATPN